MRSCDAQVLRLGLVDDDGPYVVPVDFGYDGERIYVHGARTGRRISAIGEGVRVYRQRSVQSRACSRSRSSRLTAGGTESTRRTRMSKMHDVRKTLVGIVTGLAFVAAPVAIAATAPLVNDEFITPVDGRIMSVLWWFLIPLGTAVTVMITRRLWPGIVVGAAAVVAFQYTMALLAPAEGRDAVLSAAGAWMSATVGVAIPWAAGMIFGWTATNRRRVRHDGVATL